MSKNIKSIFTHL